jgi:hypothetical protein
VPPELSRGPGYPAPMRKPNPENIYLARRAAALSRLTRPGMPPERAEAVVAAWEAEARAWVHPALCGVLGAVGWVGRRATPARVATSEP